jgi:sugar phosphate isomerase/epimerase
MLPHSRRDFVKLALASLPATALLSSLGRSAWGEGAPKPNSTVNGVRIGLNVPYSFGAGIHTGDEILQNCVQLGLSSVELRTQPVESFLGLPPLESAKNKTEAAEQVREWRKTVKLDRVKEFRDKWEAAGVPIEIVKVDGISKMSDEEIDYAFNLAKALGGRALSTEIFYKTKDVPDTEALQRVGSFADKHQMLIGYHGHSATKPEHWEAAFALAKYNGANVDLGHFVAGNNTSPVPFIEKYHDRVTHVHVKDRKFNNGPNTPFGEGDTPIVDVLHLLRDKKYNIQATIEFEYKVPADSDRMKELAKCIDYCRKALA